MDPKQPPNTPLGPQTERKGLLIVNTGKGKGKSTAAFGIAMRAWGRDMTVGIVQFLKSEGASFGEHRAAEKMGIDFVSSGDGFTWLSKDLDESAARAQHGWDLAKERIASGEYDVLILDEMTYVFNYGWVDFDAFREWLAANKPPMMHIVITGRNASDELITLADLVSEVHNVKHPLAEQGIKAQPGIEF